MANSREAKIKFSADTRDMTEQIKRANSTMAALRAGLKQNAAEMQTTGATADGLTAKHKMLSAQVEASRLKQEALSEKLAAASRIYGEGSLEAQRWSSSLARAKAEESTLTAQIADCEKAIDKMKDAARELESPLGRLTSEIGRQEDGLKYLKKEYANTVIAQGKDSDAATALKNEIDQLNRELDDNRKKLDAAGDAAEEAGKQAGASREGWSVAKQIMANLATNAIGELGDMLKEAAREVVRLGADFTASMSNVKALSGSTTEEAAKLEKAAKSLGRTTIFSASQVADAFSYMALAGWETSDMLDGIDGVLNLAASSGMELADASDLVTDYLTAFGLTAKDSAKFVDQITYAMANSNTDAAQLGEAYKNVATTASSMGVSVEDTTAALMTMANAGIKGGEAGTGLNTIITRIATNASGAGDALEELGVEVYDSNGQMRDLSEILTGTAGAWTSLTGEQQAALAKTIAGTNQYSKFTAIMAGFSEEAVKGGTSLNDYSDALDRCDGAASAMSATMQDNLQGDIAALQSATEGLGIQIFSFFEGGLRGAAQLATSAINAVTDAIAPTETTIGRFLGDVEGLIKAGQDSLKLAEDSLSGGTATVAELEAYRDILTDLAGRTDLNEFEQYQLKEAVEALSSSVPGLAEHFDEACGVLDLTNAELTEMFKNAEALAMQQALVDAQTASYKALADATLASAKADSAAAAAEKEYAEWVEKNSHSTRQSANDWGTYGAEVNAAGQELFRARRAQDEASTAMEAAKKQIEEEDKAFAGLREEYGLATPSISEASKALDSQREATEGAKEAVSGYGELTEEEMAAADEAVAEITEAYGKMRSSIEESIRDSISLMNEFSGGAEITADEILKNLHSQIEGVSNWASNMQLLGAQAGSGMSQELYDYLVEMGPQSANLVQTLVDTLQSDATKFKEISDSWGEAMMLQNNAEALAGLTSGGKAAAEAVVTGINQGAPGIASAMSSAMAGMVGAANAGMNQLRQALGQTIQGPVVNATIGTGSQLNVGQWHAEGAIFSRPTLLASASGWHGVGEAGPEAVSPISLLQDYVGAAVEGAMDGHDIDYARLADEIADALRRSPAVIEVDGRQLGRTVRGLR